MIDGTQRQMDEQTKFHVISLCSMSKILDYLAREIIEKNVPGHVLNQLNQSEVQRALAEVMVKLLMSGTLKNPGQLEGWRIERIKEPHFVP